MVYRDMYRIVAQCMSVSIRRVLAIWDCPPFKYLSANTKLPRQSGREGPQIGKESYWFITEKKSLDFALISFATLVLKRHGAYFLQNEEYPV